MKLGGKLGLDRLSDRRNDDAPVFGCSARTISRRIKVAAKATVLGTGSCGHSDPVGVPQQHVQKRHTPAVATMRQGRWQTTRMGAG